MLPATLPIGYMVLSAPPAKRSGNIITEWTDENIDRIYSAFCQLFSLSDLTKTEGPWVMLNGERNQLPMMVQAALECNIPAARLTLVDCGARPHGNTKTQFQVLAGNPIIENAKGDIVVITSWYHMARVARTIPKNVPANTNLRYWVYSSQPSPTHEVDDAVIDGEVSRILTYVNTGDLVETPEPYLGPLLWQRER